MNALINLHNALFDWLDRQSGFILPTLARFVFAAVLLVYFWKSALTKVGSGFFGIFSPSDGAYVQIFPRAMEAVSYDSSQLGFFYWLVALAGTWAEFILPALVALTVKLIPTEVFNRCRAESAELWKDGKPKRWYYAIPIALIWLLLVYWIVKAILGCG